MGRTGNRLLSNLGMLTHYSKILNLAAIFGAKLSLMSYFCSVRCLERFVGQKLLCGCAWPLNILAKHMKSLDSRY